MQPAVYVPKPYGDELLYSVLARARRHLGLVSPKGFAGLMFGLRGVLACPDLPANLDRIAWLFERWGVDPSTALRRFSLVGYYTHYLPAHKCSEVNQRLLSGRVAGLHTALGICSSTIKPPPTFRLCPECVADDLRTHGETYWRRGHQLPGVLVCAKHAVALIRTGVPTRAVGRHEVIAAEPALLAGAPDDVAGLSAAGMSHLLAIARQSVALLDEAAVQCPARTNYRARFASAGFAHQRGGLKALEEAFVDYFGAQLLQGLGALPEVGKDWNWLRGARRKQRRSLHPLKHILLELFLEHRDKAGEVARFTASEQPRKRPCLSRSEELRQQARALAEQGLTRRGIARRLQVDWKTADRLLTPLSQPDHARERALADRTRVDRDAWTAHVSSHPSWGRKQLRKAATALYARLYRNDRSFLMQTGAPARHAISRGRRDWQARDTALCGRVLAEAESLRAQEPPVRITENRIAGRLMCRALLRHYRHHLPKTVQALRAVCENDAGFRRRRLAHAVTILSQSYVRIPTWRLIREAGLNPGRLDDAGWDDVRRALEQRRLHPLLAGLSNVAGPT